MLKLTTKGKIIRHCFIAGDPIEFLVSQHLLRIDECKSLEEPDRTN